MSTFYKVKKLADNQKISLKELALKLNMGENSIYRWKNKTPTTDNLQKVADYFHVSIDYLLERTENTQYPATANEDDQLFQKFKNRPQIQEFLTELTEADTEALEQLEKIWRALHDKSQK